MDKSTFSLCMCYENMYTANAAAGINMLGRESVRDAEDIEVDCFVVIATFLMSGQMVEFTIREVEIQT